MYNCLNTMTDFPIRTIEELQAEAKSVQEQRAKCVEKGKFEEAARLRDMEKQLLLLIESKK